MRDVRATAPEMSAGLRRAPRARDAAGLPCLAGAPAGDRAPSVARPALDAAARRRARSRPCSSRSSSCSARGGDDAAPVANDLGSVGDARRPARRGAGPAPTRRAAAPARRRRRAARRADRAAPAPARASAAAAAPAAPPPAVAPRVRRRARRARARAQVERSAVSRCARPPRVRADDATRVHRDGRPLRRHRRQLADRRSEAAGGEATFDLRIPTERLDHALAALSRLGHVPARTQSLRTSRRSFTSRAGAPDRRPRRAPRPAARARPRPTTQNAGRQPQGAAAHRRRAGSPALKGELSSLRRRADLSRVDRHRARRRHRGARTGGAGTWTPGDAAGDALRVLEVLAGVALVALAVLVPLALLGAAVALAVRGARRRRRGRARSRLTRRAARRPARASRGRTPSRPPRVLLLTQCRRASKRRSSCSPRAACSRRSARRSSRRSRRSPSRGPSTPATSSSARATRATRATSSAAATPGRCASTPTAAP